jgi:hypothetical protein
MPWTRTTKEQSQCRTTRVRRWKSPTTMDMMEWRAELVLMTVEVSDEETTLMTQQVDRKMRLRTRKTRRCKEATRQELRRRDNVEQLMRTVDDPQTHWR